MLKLVTERMLIRPLVMSDLPALSTILSDPEVMKYSVRGVCDEAATRKFIEWCLSCYNSHGVGPWALIDKITSELIGFCGVCPEAVAGQEEIGLGYRLAKRYWGKGLATESVRAVIDYTFNENFLDSLVAIIESENIASVCVVEKAGFNSFDNVEFQGLPVRLYRLSREQWSLLKA